MALLSLLRQWTVVLPPGNPQAPEAHMSQDPDSSPFSAGGAPR
jgi:hypothetical protein